MRYIMMYSTRNSNRELREAIVIQGKPFYRSTGINSGMADTYFPFFGVQEKLTSPKLSKKRVGWLIKPHKTSYEVNTMLTWLNSKSFCKSLIKNYRLHRFGSIENMCISASLGGGIWNKYLFKRLSEALRIEFPNYFLNSEQINEIKKSTFDGRTDIFGEPQETNSWLKKNLASVPVGSQSHRYRKKL